MNRGKVYDNFVDLAHDYFQWRTIDLSSSHRPLPSDFTKEVPLSRPQGRILRVLRIRGLKKPEEIYMALVRECLIGRYLKNFHVFLLFEFLWKQKTVTKQTAALMALILLVRTKVRPYKWTGTCQSVHAYLSQHLSPQELRRVSERFFEIFHQIPKRDPNISLHIEAVEDIRILKCPEEPRRIGVGYKDKGSIGSGLTECESEIEVIVPVKHFDWDANLEKVFSLFPELKEILSDSLKRKGKKPFCVASTMRPDDGSVVGTETRKSINPKLRQYVGLGPFAEKFLLGTLTGFGKP